MSFNCKIWADGAKRWIGATTVTRFLGGVICGRGYFCATVGQMTEEMIKQYLENHFEPCSNDNFRQSSLGVTRREVDAWAVHFQYLGSQPTGFSRWLLSRNILFEVYY